ncbi:MAG: OsmC family protein [Anaerolineae bacterium]|nr:OsmC family protein [Anaerolineae bacterium]
MLNVKVTLDAGYETLIETRGLTATADEPIEDGGTNKGMTPRELLLGALGACAAITAKLYATRKGWPLEGVEINVSSERYKASEYPGTYTGTSANVSDFRQLINFKGDLTEEQRTRLLEIAGKCPVHRILTEDNFLFEELVTEAISEES